MVMSTVRSRLTDTLLEVDLAEAREIVADDPPFGVAEYVVKGLRLAYENSKVMEILYRTESANVFVRKEFLDQPETWPNWLAEVVDRHRPTVF